MVFDGIPVRVYQPVEGKSSQPGFVYYHGGGFVYGDLGNTLHMITGHI